MTLSWFIRPLAGSLLCFTLLSGCKSTQTPNQPLPKALLHSAHFTLKQVESRDEIFALTPQMKKQLNLHFPPGQRDLSVTRTLLQFLLKNGDTSLNYQSGATLTASQTFKQLNANCLSLSILAFSMADHLGLRGQFQRVHIPEYWALDRGFNLLTGHVNLKLSPGRITTRGDMREMYSASKPLIIDFDPDSRKREFPATQISKDRVAAMFYNNKGAAAMVSHDYDRAYSYFVAAVNTDAAYSGAWGNLGILLRLNDHLDEAEQAYRYAVAMDPQNNTALGNLAILYDLTDRPEQAEKIKQSLAAKRRGNPYYYIALGNEAYVDKNYQDAIGYYRRAQQLDGKIHDSYFGLARTYFNLGDMKRTKEYLAKAQKNADFDYEKARYQRKLESLDLLVKQ